MSLLELLKVMYCFIKVFLQKSAIYVLQTVLLLDAPHERLIYVQLKPLGLCPRSWLNLLTKLCYTTKLQYLKLKLKI